MIVQEADLKTLGSFQTELADDDFQVEFEILLPYSESEFKNDEMRQKINDELNNIDEQLERCQAKVDELNAEIDRLTNHADGLDYAVAVGSGILTGLIDSFFVGKIDIESGKAISHETINDFIMKTSKRHGYKGERLDGAISNLENKYKVAQDNIWKGKKISSAKSHHLDDLAHHPSIMGMISAIIVEFFRVGIFADKDGEIHLVFVGDKEKLMKSVSAIVFSGVVLWLIHVAEKYSEDELENDIPQPIKKLIKLIALTPVIIPVLKCVHNWALHLVSDMGGSKNTSGGGMGIPGMFISFLKEISMLPGLSNTELPKLVNDLYVKEKIDLRTEFAVVHELKRQAIPVLINELLVRGFYFIRRLTMEIKEKNVESFSDLKNVDWKKTLPFRNRTVVRMLTIATGTFTAVDLADAGIRAVIESGGFNLKTGISFVLRINFVGIGRFAFAVFTDVRMGHQRNKKVNERLYVYMEMLHLSNAKVFYKQANMWISAQESEKALQETYNLIKDNMHNIAEECRTIFAITENITDISNENIEKHNPGLLDELADIF